MPLAHQLLLLLLDDPGLSGSLAEDLDRLDRDNPDFRLLHRVREVLTAHGSVASRDGRGGTAPVRVREQLDELLARADALRGRLA